MNRHNGLLPFAAPDTKSLRRAAANIIRDIQRDCEETDQMTADKLGVSKGTVANVRNENVDIGSLLLAKIAAAYGEEAIAPWKALYAPCGGEDVPDLVPIAAAMIAAVSSAKGPKGKLDALPLVKDLIEAAHAFVTSGEQMRLRAVS